MWLQEILKSNLLCFKNHVKDQFISASIDGKIRLKNIIIKTEIYHKTQVFDFNI